MTAATVAATGDVLLNALLVAVAVDETAFALVVGDEFQTVSFAVFRLAVLVADEPWASPCVTLWKFSFTSPSADEILESAVGGERMDCLPAGGIAGRRQAAFRHRNAIDR